jgi:hypothetical protein
MPGGAVCDIKFQILAVLSGVDAGLILQQVFYSYMHAYNASYM